MDTHETYVSFETAKLLEQAGFNWSNSKNSKYHSEDGFEESPDGIWLPRLDVAQKWLRETKGYAVSVYPSDESDGWLVSLDLIEDSSSIWTKDLNNTYEEALEAGIKKALEIILEKGE